ncbi:hypothetical protein PHYBOEH_003794 [Phytophthora boehmeriae]|uniref:Uncharacterized protein n=1 Tax=Phytophthora boehmeriae TaxID=109152 RepID=A0A8T1WPM6_9STRA|nr:hypothetical protein PHYBOEH_003794 [Phytophthora boehmeriae]
MHSSRWRDRVSCDIKTTLVSKYADLCRQSCIVTPPCCHKTDYSHLPIADVNRTPSTALKLLPSQLSRYKALCRQFCRHKQPPRAVLDYAFNTFGDEKASILLNELTLPRIMDVERRATLLMSLMYLRPNTRTNCCGADFCFNCKCSGHHESCKEDFDEDTNLVRCRRCRVLLLKVDGCDAVNCVCGFSMTWGAELNYRALNKKKLLPVDIFDATLFNGWLMFHGRQSLVNRDMLNARVLKFAFSVKAILRPVLAAFIWRRRFRKVLTGNLGPYCVVKRVKHVERSLPTVKPAVDRFVSAFIWRWRFHRTLLKSMQTEFYWRAYKRWHPEEVEAADDEASAFLNIGAIDED